MRRYVTVGQLRELVAHGDYSKGAMYKAPKPRHVVASDQDVIGAGDIANRLGYQVYGYAVEDEEPVLFDAAGGAASVRESARLDARNGAAAQSLEERDRRRCRFAEEANGEILRLAAADGDADDSLVGDECVCRCTAAATILRSDCS